MRQEIIQVYLMPGMAASPKIFEHIKLSEAQFKLHYLEWIIPLVNETIEDYSLRMIKNIKHENIVLIGVSFGGILVQEMSKHIKVLKLIIISSIKSVSELPWHMLLAKITKAYVLVPTQLASNIDVLAKYAYGTKVSKRLELYKKYLSVNDSKYLSWAIKNLVCWSQEKYDSKIIHIHGDKDAVFSIKYISNYINVKGGTHIMIINKYKWFNAHLPSIILSD